MALNQTSFSSLESLAVNILEALIPGYPFISEFLETLDLDISWVVRFCVIPLLIITCGHYFHRNFSQHLFNLFTSSVKVDASDTLFEIIWTFLVHQNALTGLRSMVATTRPDKSADPDSDNFNTCGFEPPNFTGLATRKRLRLEPPEDERIWFRYNGRFFRFQRSKERATWGFIISQTLDLTVLGFSLQPLEDLITEAQHQWYSKLKPETTIMRPLPKEERDRGGYPWAVITRRPVRPIDTVVLEESMIQEIVEDIANFWSRATLEWYSKQGIAYRRGYHFWGPPGTGKSSLAFSLAGVFNVDIYCVSVNDPDLTETGLLRLLSELPGRSILLLEDIDTAGLQRESQRSNDQGKNKSGLSLSGLLNAIDGVASSEGRILIMTSNVPDSLDNALTRPGRIDFTKEFRLASRQQSQKIFLRMYSNRRGISSSTATMDALDDVELQRLAARFKDEIPDRLFSPAQLQGYLLTRTDPMQAVNEVSMWRDGILESEAGHTPAQPR